MKIVSFLPKNQTNINILKPKNFTNQRVYSKLKQIKIEINMHVKAKLKMTNFNQFLTEFSNNTQVSRMLKDNFNKNSNA